MEIAENRNVRLRYYFLFLICVSFVLLIVSRNSFLYKFNNAQDANTFYLSAKYMLNGKVLYRDFFEQKGPIIYFLNAVGQILIPKSFHGMYVIEIIFGFFYFKYAYMTLECLNPNSEKNVIITSLGCSSSYAVPMLCHGGQVEEFALPLYAFLVYQIVKSIHTNSDISRLALFSIGIQAACIFWSKYLVLMVYVLSLIFYVGYCVYKKFIKRALKTFLYIVAGFLVISLIMLLYFVYTNSLKEMVQIYFIKNIFGYHPIFEQVNIFQKLLNHTIIFFTGLSFAVIYIPLYFIMVDDVTSPVRKSKRTVVKMFLVVVLFALVVCLIVCGMSFNYYYIPCTVFNFLILYFLYDRAEEFSNRWKNKLQTILFLIALFPVIACLIYTAVDFRKYKQDIIITETVADVVKENGYDDIYILNTMDAGLYYNLDYLPDRYHFIANNSNFAEVSEQYEDAICSNKADCVVMAVDEPMLEHVGYIDEYFRSYGYKLLYDSGYNTEGLALRVYGQ